MLETLARFMLEKQGFYITFMLLLVFSVYVNRYNKKYAGGKWTQKGRFYFFLGIVIFLLYCAALLTLEGPVPFTFFPVLALLVLVFGFVFLRKFWNFRFGCANCGEKLDIAGIIMDEENNCAVCRKEAMENQAEKDQDGSSK